LSSLIHKTDNIPDFTLYGESSGASSLELLHCESLVVRSQQHNWRIKPHRHSGISQLFYLQQGQAIAHLDGQQLELRSPCVLVVPEGCVHDFNWSEQTQGQALSVAAPLLNRISRLLGGAESLMKIAAVHSIPASPTLITTIFNSISEEYQQQQVSRELMFETLVTALIVSLNRLAQPNQTTAKQIDRGHRHFSSFNQLLEQHYSSHWTVAKYSQQLGISAPHLNSICRKLGRQTALAIIHQRLLLEAKRSLTYTGRTIAEIAYQLGFAEPSHFTRFFKGKAGKSPKQFRGGS